MHNASLFVKNVQFCAKERGMKIGELERSVGVCLGYLSRWSSGKQTSAPTLDIACRLADAVGENLENLVTVDYVNLNRLGELASELKKKEEEAYSIRRQMLELCSRTAIAAAGSLTDEEVKEYLHDLKDA